jgi:flagellar basal-body rod protein FlgG
MYQGFYNLVSGMLTQNRDLNTISNNMVNIQTPGYKSDTMLARTFDEEMLIRTGTVSKGNPTELATSAKIVSAQQTYVDYTQGSLRETDSIYDFALSGNGFFCIRTPEGERYTRNGSFSVDEDGYLILNELGQVLSEDNQPIQVTSENFSADGGTFRLDGEVFGTLKVVDFADYDQLHKEDNGLFSTNQAQIEAMDEIGGGETGILWKAIEKSNVNMVEEMTAMMSSQRALQSAAQVLKMYDQMLGKASTDIGRL